MTASGVEKEEISAARSRNMSAIKGKNTAPEMLVRKALHAQGFRYRLHVRTLPGKPDLVLKKHRLAIFVHGCFWHRHQGCFYTSTPATRKAFWQQKFLQNQQRDRQNQQLLINAGWRVLVIWECGLRFVEPDLAFLADLVRGEALWTEWPPQPPRPADRA